MYQQPFQHLVYPCTASTRAEYVTDSGPLLCSDSSPERLDTYLNVEGGNLPTESETTGLVSGLDKFKLWAGLEPSPELIAISMGVQNPVIAVQFTPRLSLLFRPCIVSGQPHCVKSSDEGQEKLDYMMNPLFAHLGSTAQHCQVCFILCSVFCSRHLGPLSAWCFLSVQG